MTRAAGAGPSTWEKGRSTTTATRFRHSENLSRVRGESASTDASPSTQKAERWALRARLLPTFGLLPLDRITRARVTRWFDEYSRTAPGGANHVLGLLGRILNHALACGHLQTNPTRGVKPNPRPKLTRFLSHEEVQRLHRALDHFAATQPARAPQVDIIRLLLLTGCRKSEIITLRWQGRGRGHAQPARRQDGSTAGLPQWRPARAILDRQPRSASAYVFPLAVESGPALFGRFRDLAFGAPESRDSKTFACMTSDTPSPVTPCCRASRCRSYPACSVTSDRA